MEQTFASTRRERMHLRPVGTGFPAESGAVDESSALAHATEVDHLRFRIAQLQGTSLGSRLLPTFPGLGRLLPGGGIKRGCSYSVSGSTGLALSLLAGPASSGSWCAVVGVPGLNPEAAASFGIPLERLVLIPRPGPQWLNVVSALADIMGAIFLGPLEGAAGAGLDRLAARLRERGTVLVNAQPWGRAEAQLRLEANYWQGLSRGCGHLSARSIRVCSRWRNGTQKRAEIQFPSPGTVPQVVWPAAGQPQPAHLMDDAGSSGSQRHSPEQQSPLHDAPLRDSLQYGGPETAALLDESLGLAVG